MKKKSSVFLKLIVLGLFCSLGMASFAQEEKVLIRHVRETKDPTAKVLRMIDLGLYYSSKNLAKSRNLQKKINQSTKNLNGKIALNIALYNAEIYRLEREFGAYYKTLKPFESVNLSQESPRNQEKYFQNLGFYYVVSLNFKKADLLLHKSLRVSNSINNYSEICLTYCYLSYKEILSKNKKKALAYADNAFDMAKKSRNKLDLALFYYFQSAVYDFFGQPDIALSKELLSFKYAKDCENYPLLSLISKRLGDKQVMIQNLDEALYYFNSTYLFSKSLADYRLQGLALASISNVKRLQKKFEESLAYSKRAFIVINQIKSSGGLGFAELNLGRIYVDQKLYDLALKHLALALPYFEKGLNRDLEAEVYQLKGLIYKRQKQYPEALLQFNKFVKIQQRVGEPNRIFEIYPTIAEIYEEQGNKGQALQLLEEYVAFSEKNNKNLAARKIAELNELYRSKQRDQLIAKQTSILEKQRRQRELSKAKLENVSLRNKFQTYIIIGFVIILILMTIIGVYRNKQASIQQKRREAEMSQALLRTQMNPHFIFNAMSVIQSYIFENDTKNSSRFLVNFSRLIRLILENSPKALIHLETDIEILQKYLETQKLRFEDRFVYEIVCPDELLFDNVQIPPMITQPFVENSIEHGQLHTLLNGSIRIVFSQQNKMLNILIEDNGIGRTKSGKRKSVKEHNSMALNITRNRINMINEKYNSSGSLTIEDLDEAKKVGTKVLISLPYLTDQTLT